MKIATLIGDGPAWFVLALVMVVSGDEGREGALRLAVSFLLNLSVYKILKTSITRPRPFERILVVLRMVREVRAALADARRAAETIAAARTGS